MRCCVMFVTAVCILFLLKHEVAVLLVTSNPVCAAVYGPVHITWEKFENAAFVSAVRLTIHTNPSRSFSKTLFNPEEFENASSVF